MLKHTKKIKEIYEDIQRKLYYMIPEKWDSLYLYSSVLENSNSEGNSGELFFYYFPKGILRKKMVNVYEIPSKFNLNESKYVALVGILYNKIKELRQEFEKNELDSIWSNITIVIKNNKFKAEYDYTNLEKSYLNSYQRHIIWRYENLGIGLEQLEKNEKSILKLYLSTEKELVRKEKFEMGIYIQSAQNIIGYTSIEVSKEQNDTYNSGINDENKENKKEIVNQLLMSKSEINQKINKIKEKK